jgi:hypothetical protein
MLLDQQRRAGFARAHQHASLRMQAGSRCIVLNSDDE